MEEREGKGEREKQVKRSGRDEERGEKGKEGKKVGER